VLVLWVRQTARTHRFFVAVQDRKNVAGRWRAPYSTRYSSPAPGTVPPPSELTWNAQPDWCNRLYLDSVWGNLVFFFDLWTQTSWYKKDGYRQLNVRQLGSLRPWKHRGKCYMNRKRTQRSMYTPIFNRLRAIARYWSEIATFSYPLHLTSPYGVAPGTIAVTVTLLERGFNAIHLPRLSEGRTQGRPKCAKNVLKWRIFKLPAWITGKRLKIDGYIQVYRPYAFHSNMAVSAAILEIFNVKEWPDLEIWVWGPSRSLKKARFDRPLWLSISPPL